jgi:hypothetical protein
MIAEMPFPLTERDASAILGDIQIIFTEKSRHMSQGVG